MTKSAVRMARDALAAGEAALPRYGSRYSRRDYTQPQLFALLALRQLLRTDYRGVVALAAEWGELREALGLARVPHYSTLARAAPRLLAGAEKGGRSSGLNSRWSGAHAPPAWRAPRGLRPWTRPGSRPAT
jgi:hypothetical protein